MPSSDVRQRLRLLRHGAWRVAVEVATTVHVAVVLAVVEASIRWMSLPRLSGLLGCPVDLSPHVGGPPIASSHELGRRARRQLRCTQRVADAWPLSHGPCLRRALVGGHLLRRSGARIRLGTYDEDDRLVAHAWLEVGGRPLEEAVNYRGFESGRHGTSAEQPT